MRNGLDAEFVGLESPTGFPSPSWGAHACQGIYYRTSGVTPRVAFVAVHYSLDFSEHYLAPMLAERGFGFFGFNTRFRGIEHLFRTDHAVAEIGAGVRWLKDVAGAETVVLLGNSGGGSLMAAYHSHAVAHAIKPLPGTRYLARGTDDLVPGDLYISLAAHPSRADLLTNVMDPSVTDEGDPLSIDPTLDMYNPENGPPFSPEFQKRYRQAQRHRNERISSWADAELERLAGSGTHERVFAVPRVWADLRYLDVSIDPSNRPAPACWLGDPQRANAGVAGIGQVSTLRTWQSMWSLRHSQCEGRNHLPNVTVPSLVIGAESDTGIYPSQVRALYDYVGATDKELHTLPGDHYFLGLPNARVDVADLIAAWVQKRT
jgi:hypothetical protein